MSTIELKNVTKRFGAFVAVKDVDLTVAAGEVVCLLGPSGCGKTTTLRMIAGLEQTTAGDVIVAVDGRSISSPQDLNRELRSRTSGFTLKVVRNKLERDIRIEK